MTELKIREPASDWYVTIHQDGRLEINPAFTMDEAAAGFWRAIELTRPEWGHIREAVDQLDAYIRDCIEDRKRQNSYDAQIALQCVRRKMAKLGMIEI